MSRVDDDHPIEPSAVNAYTAALLRGELESPANWMIARQRDVAHNSGAVAVLRSVEFLVRHRDALSRPRVASGPGPRPAHDAAAATPAMSTFTVIDLEPADSLLTDREWLAAHNFEPIGNLDVAGGGMGLIALAWHTVMKREVVLKVARGESNELRFQREIQVHAKLGGHTNIAVTRTPLRYREASVLVVDYVPGLSLRKWVELLGPMNWRESVDCVRQAAVGLGHAHQLGVTHRDVKSSNLVRSSRDGVVKVIDWGLALDREAPAEVLTLTGQFLGTPAYCAPEQGKRPSDASPASDLYGLGCVWYELLTGSPPFQGDLVELAAAHDHQPVPRLPARLGVPEAVEIVLRTLLEKDPERRFHSADEFTAALDLAVTERPIDRRFWFAVIGVGAILTGFALARPRGAAPVSVPSSSLDLTPSGLVIQLLDNSTHPHRSGKLGEKTYEAQEGDQVVLRAKLVSESYCYLLSFRPDGKIDVWWPTDEDQRPVRTMTPSYPAGGLTTAINLDHGVGLQAFALVVSPEPLPDYRTWLAQQGPPPWRASIQADAGIVWVGDGDQVEMLSESQIRGTGAPARGAFGAVAELARWLRSRPGVSVIDLKAFAVRSDKP
jgi:serine/threonine protein kinase